MNAKQFFSPVALALLAVASARADVMYQCIDADGHKSFLNIKSATRGARCTVMDLGAPMPPASNRSARSRPSPENFPRVDDNTQRARDAERRRILENELDAERKSLAQAKKDLDAQGAIALPNERMVGGGISGGKVEERLQPFRDKVGLHERNIEAIEKELYRLR